MRARLHAANGALSRAGAAADADSGRGVHRDRSFGRGRGADVVFISGGLDRVKALIIFSVVLRMLVALFLVSPLENDREGTPRDLLAAIFALRKHR